MSERPSDLEALREAQPPRPAAVVKRYAGKIEPIAGFIIYGIMIVMFLGSALGLGGMLGGIAIGKAIGAAKGSATMEYLGLGGFGLGIVLAFWIFLVWARGKRGRARTLIEHGDLIRGTVKDRASDRAAQVAARLAFAASGARLGVSWYRVELELGGRKRSVLAPFQTKPADGDTREVLAHPESRYALAFDEAGKAYVCGVR